VVATAIHSCQENDHATNGIDRHQASLNSASGIESVDLFDYLVLCESEHAIFKSNQVANVLIERGLSIIVPPINSIRNSAFLLIIERDSADTWCNRRRLLLAERVAVSESFHTATNAFQWR
jgi:hypothetical protein